MIRLRDKFSGEGRGGGGGGGGGGGLMRGIKIPQQYFALKMQGGGGGGGGGLCAREGVFAGHYGTVVFYTSFGFLK